MHLIPACSFFSKSGFVSGSTRLFTSTNQIYSTLTGFVTISARILKKRK